MRIAIVGGTGLLGKRVVARLRARGHEVRVLSRGVPEYRVDLTTGEGLGPALAGCEAVVDASNSTAKATEVLIKGSRLLLAAEKAAGVGHHVCVSVVGCERIPMGYFSVKANQERVVEEGAVPWSIVRATQFHDYVAAIFAGAGRYRVLPMLRIPVQTVSVVEVARTVADVVEAGPCRGRLQIAGPQIVDARELARTWRSTSGRRAIALPMPLPGKAGRALRSGAATVVRPDIQGTTTFATWLRTGGIDDVERAS